MDGPWKKGDSDFQYGHVWYQFVKFQGGWYILSLDSWWPPWRCLVLFPFNPYASGGTDPFGDARSGACSGFLRMSVDMNGPKFAYMQSTGIFCRSPLWHISFDTNFPVFFWWIIFILHRDVNMHSPEKNVTWKSMMNSLVSETPFRVCNEGRVNLHGWLRSIFFAIHMLHHVLPGVWHKVYTWQYFRVT